MCKAGIRERRHAARVVFPSIVGRPTMPDTIIGNDQNDSKLCERRGAEHAWRTDGGTYPIEYGIVTNWHDLKKVCHHRFYKQPRVALTEAPRAPYRGAPSPKARCERTTRGGRDVHLAGDVCVWLSEIRCQMYTTPPL